MAIDVGDTVPLLWLTVDQAGAPSNVGLAALTITLPDGSIVQPALTNAGPGSYSPTSPFVATQAGRHELRWLGTGANAQAYSDVFDVLGTAPGLISLDQARRALRLPANAPAALTLDDEDLRDLIAAARGPMEDICGPLLPTEYDDWHDGGGVLVRLMTAPMLAVASVVECYGSGYTRTLTPQLLDGGAALDAFGYTADLRDGTLLRRAMGRPARFAEGRRNVHVIGTAGRASVPANVQRAARRLIRWLWQTEMNGGRQMAGAGPESVAYTPSGHAVPSAVIELCAAERRVVTVG